MKISIGADHGGVDLRAVLIDKLTADGHEVIDHGTNTRDSVDYPDYARQVALDVAAGRAERGVIVCTTGIGVSIAANKVPGARAAVVYNEDGARYSRWHNDANIIAFGQKYTTPYLAGLFLDIFLAESFEEGGRHSRRVDKIRASEQADRTA